MSSYGKRREKAVFVVRRQWARLRVRLTTRHSAALDLTDQDPTINQMMASLVLQVHVPDMQGTVSRWPWSRGSATHLHTVRAYGNATTATTWQERDWMPGSRPDDPEPWSPG